MTKLNKVVGTDNQSFNNCSLKSMFKWLLREFFLNVRTLKLRKFDIFSINTGSSSEINASGEFKLQVRKNQWNSLKEELNTEFILVVDFGEF